MRTNTVKNILAAGGTSIGTMIFEFSTTGIGRISAEAGAEFLIFDMEHTGWSIETIRGLIATTRSSNAIPMVRVPATAQIDLGGGNVVPASPETLVSLTGHAVVVLSAPARATAATAAGRPKKLVAARISTTGQ